MEKSIVEARVHEMIGDLRMDAENPDFAAMRRGYKERYGVGTTDNTLRKAYGRLSSNGFLAETKPIRKHRRRKDDTTLRLRGVPGNLKAVHRAATAAGGYEATLKMVEIIQQMGGAAKFVRAVRLLKAVQDIVTTVEEE